MGGEFFFEAFGDVGVFFDEVYFFAGVSCEVVELEFWDFVTSEFFFDLGVACGLFGVVGELPLPRAVAVVSASAIVLLDEVGAACCVSFAKEGC